MMVAVFHALRRRLRSVPAPGDLQSRGLVHFSANQRRCAGWFSPKIWTCPRCVTPEPNHIPQDRSNRMSDSHEFSRRSFLHRTAAVAGSVGVAGFMPQVVPAAARGANERIGVGFIGTGGRAQAHIGICLKLKEQGPLRHGGRVRRLPPPRRGGGQEDRREDLSQSPGAAGRSARRCGVHRHARPAPCPAGDRRRSGPARTCIARSR